MSNLSLGPILDRTERTLYGLSVLIQEQTGENIKTIHKRLSKWALTGIPPKFEIADRDLNILGYMIEIRKL